ncbi:MAG: gamma-glutamylcyclotransferase [Comamonas sp.]|nr:gamma-glutamylcyclotransferase [Candidatus Comamonas equi]
MSTPSQLSSRPYSDWQPCGISHVAVYGTLRAGGVNDIARLRPAAQIVGRTTLTGTLYDMGWYPGLSLQGSQQVLAEVYPLDAALEQVLDGYEGIWPQDTGEYTKRTITVPVALTGGGTQMLAVLVYEALPAAVAQLPVIETDDWLAWFNTHKAHLQNKK